MMEIGFLQKSWHEASKYEEPEEGKDGSCLKTEACLYTIFKGHPTRLPTREPQDKGCSLRSRRVWIVLLLCILTILCLRYSVDSLQYANLLKKAISGQTPACPYLHDPYCLWRKSGTTSHSSPRNYSTLGVLSVARCPPSTVVL